MSKVLFSKTVHFYTPTIISLLLCVMCVIVWVPGKVSLICCVMSEVLLLRGRGLSPSPISHSDSWHSSTSSGQTHTPSPMLHLTQSPCLPELNRANMHAENLIINCASIIKWKFATSTSEGTNGKHLLYLHDDRESSKRGYIVRLKSFCRFPSGLWGIQSHWLSTKFACSCKHTKVTTRCSTCV